MTKEFDLSKKIMPVGNIVEVIDKEDVKEFIRLLKEKTTCVGCSKEYEYAFKTFNEIIDKIAGEKLI